MKVRLAIVAAIVAVAGFGSGANALSASRNVGGFCVADLVEVGSKAVPAPVQCFATFVEAAVFATDGRVVPGPAATVHDQFEQFDSILRNSVLTDALAGSKTVLGADWVDSNYGGNVLLWTTTNSNGCANGASFGSSTMQVAVWNDVVSSARSYQGCSFFGHYEHSGWGGAVVDCGYSCSYIGDAMNDRTSSVWFSRS